ncbi:MAG TPA: outer membrane lipoprotein carrier protein LolA [Calditrichia bacterium]|nr:outer-membrane lipoprotein carrier protein LolA [Calditrichota bacterium]HQU70977.1 outer membrane lipoprotein carrier protein LolA [Calditrichia bacterium]HQV32557.1 outer membrane lipoprotein carrier protein LolA [Calditrichia bacterium]
MKRSLSFFRQMFALLCLMLFLNPADAGNADKVIKSIQNTYRNAKNLELEFRQVNRFKFTGTENSVSGRLMLSGEDRFRFDADDQVLVSNGEILWRFNKIENQVLIDRFREEEKEDFFNSFLYNVQDHYYGDILAEEKSEGKKIYEIKLTPKPEQQSPFAAIRIWVTDKTWEIRKVIYVRFNGDETEYAIEKLNFDPRFDEADFSFTPPADTRVIDLRM